MSLGFIDWETWL